MSSEESSANAEVPANGVPAEFVKTNNAFSATAYREVLKENTGNFIVSPFSTEIILTLVHTGCRDETAEEIKKAIHLPDNDNEFKNDMKILLPTLKGNADYVLHTANKVYIQNDFQIKKEFEETATKIYLSDTEKVDFSKKNETAETINTWVKEQTNNKICDLIDPKILNELSRMVLVNALYFKAVWLRPFPYTSTTKSDFYKTVTDIIQVDMMFISYRCKTSFKYDESSELNAKFLELSFRGEEASMVFVLPNEIEGILTLEENIVEVINCCNFNTRHMVNISLPKFSIKTQVDFKRVLENLGVKAAFDERLADLSGIAGEKGDLLVDGIFQKAFIELNEKGVEAGAATCAHLRIPLCGMRIEPKEFNANHPFLFCIKVKDIIVFIGRVTNPEV